MVLAGHPPPAMASRAVRLDQRVRPPKVLRLCYAMSAMILRLFRRGSYAFAMACPALSTCTMLCEAGGGGEGREGGREGGAHGQLAEQHHRSLALV
eukprot:2406920-Rhodomonas_salina.1